MSKIHSFSSAAVIGRAGREMSPYALAAAAVLIVFLCAVKNRRSGKLPPSPPSLPLIGHLHLIGRLAHRSLHELHLRYGGGACGLLFLQLGRRRTLVVCTAAAAADLFRNHDLAFASRPRSVAADRMMYGCRNVSFAPYGEDWRRGKKVAVVHLLSPRRVASFAPVRAAEAAALVARARRAAEAGEAVELRELLYGYTNAVVTRAATGAAGATAERLKQLMGNTAALVTGFQPEDVLPDAPARFVTWATGLDKKLDDMAEAWDKFLSEIVAAHEEKRGGCAGEEEDEDFLDVLLRLRREGADGLELTDDRIKATIKDMIAAATGTSSETLEWAMAELVANPRVMAKLQDEITRVAGAAADELAIAEADLDKMEYLKAVFKEVLRLHPPAPLLVPHESTAPAVVRGYEIPARTALFVNAWAIGRDPAAWDAPEEFRPERFVGGGPAADFRGTDYELIPFGAGRRMCPGINFALPVLELALASILCHFDWELPAGMRPADLDMGEAPGLTTPPRVPLVLVPRCKTLARPAN
ncbi:cytochrome P450 71A1-like [Panicum hallii]|nr:cytochrome P450 71A1-like [Panicum hallii]